MSGPLSAEAFVAAVGPAGICYVGAHRARRSVIVDTPLGGFVELTPGQARALAAELRGADRIDLRPVAAQLERSALLVQPPGGVA